MTWGPLPTTETKAAADLCPWREDEDPPETKTLWYPQCNMLIHNRRGGGTRESIQSQSDTPIRNTLTHTHAYTPQAGSHPALLVAEAVPDKLFLPHCRKRSSTTRTPATEFCVLQPSRYAGVFGPSGSGAALFTKMLSGIKTDTFCLYLDSRERILLSFSLFLMNLDSVPLKMSCPGPLETLAGIHCR